MYVHTFHCYIFHGITLVYIDNFICSIIFRLGNKLSLFIYLQTFFLKTYLGKDSIKSITNIHFPDSRREKNKIRSSFSLELNSRTPLTQINTYLNLSNHRKIDNSSLLFPSQIFHFRARKKNSTPIYLSFIEAISRRFQVYRYTMELERQ